MNHLRGNTWFQQRVSSRDWDESSITPVPTSRSSCVATLSGYALARSIGVGNSRATKSVFYVRSFGRGQGLVISRGRRKVKIIVVNKHYQNFDIDIMRPGPFGNPFVIGTDGTREEVIAKCERYIDAHPGIMEKLVRAARAAKEAGAQDFKLGCCCAPRPCHGDIYKRKLEAALLRRSTETE